MRRKTIYDYTVKFMDNGQGGLIADVPAFPEICTEGRTPEEALANAREAIVACIEHYRAEGRTLPRDVHYKAVRAPKFFRVGVPLPE